MSIDSLLIAAAISILGQGAKIAPVQFISTNLPLKSSNVFGPHSDSLAILSSENNSNSATSFRPYQRFQAPDNHGATINVLLSLLDRLDRASPFAKADLAKSLGVNIWTKRSSGILDIFTVSDIVVGNILRIDEVEFRQVPNRKGYTAILKLETTCIMRADIIKEYPDVKITGIPHGHSLEEETTFSTVREWGQLSFGFKERDRDCISSIMFNSF
jgi:hypothetical protein